MDFLKKLFLFLQASTLCFLVLILRELLGTKSEPVVVSMTMSDFDKLMKQRTLQVERECQKKTVKANIKTGENLYVLYDRKLVWCPVFKAASTNWMYNLLPLAGLDDEDIENLRRDYGYKHPNMVAREVAPIYSFLEIRQVIQSEGSIRFLIVRHPFERLLSAFRDKLERIGARSSLVQDRYYNLYGRKIVEKYREKAIQKFGPDFFSVANNFGSPVKVENRTTGVLPSWWEFVQWITDADQTKHDMDEHWRPVRNLNLS